MSWSIGYDSNQNRDIGYGVPALCDHPDCDKEIHRGLSYVCGGEPYGGEGCGLFFCNVHLFIHPKKSQCCDRCFDDNPPFKPKPDIKKWIKWKLTHESWQKWRDENPNEVEQMKIKLNRGDV